MEKQTEYTVNILAAIQGLFNENSDNYIGPMKLRDGDNLTTFFNCLANLAPTQVYNTFTGEKLDILEFNHIANKLCFQSLNKQE